jgi:DNA-binding NtrC family response regulator
MTSDAWVTALTEAGHSVHTAMLAREVLPVLREGGIDVVVIDAYDPRSGIVELAHSIDALPEPPPIVLISDSPFAPEISARIGAAAFLAKPCEPRELVIEANRLMGSQPPVRIIEDAPTGKSRTRI